MTTKFQMRPFEKQLTKVNVGGYLDEVKYLVFHFVGAAGNAQNNADYFENTYREASAHLFIDPKRTKMVVELDRVAWHVGDGLGRYGVKNSNSIGVELCQDTSTGNNVWTWDFNAETRRESILVFEYLMRRFKVPIERVVRHYDASRKMCPGNWATRRSDGSLDWRKWELWKQDLKTYVETGVLLDSQRGINYSEGSKSGKPSDIVTTPDKLPRVSNEEMANRVERGVYGNGADRIAKLKAAGYNYRAIQDIVDARRKERERKGEKQPGIEEVGWMAGVYKFQETVNVRSAPRVAEDTYTGYVYSPGDTVVIESVIDKDGYKWGLYESWSGSSRAVALGKTDASEVYAKKVS